MSKKHFVAIAEALKNLREHTKNQALPTVVRHDLVAAAIADVFAEGNPRFDRQRFFAACGITFDSKYSEVR